MMLKVGGRTIQPLLDLWAHVCRDYRQCSGMVQNDRQTGTERGFKHPQTM